MPRTAIRTRPTSEKIWSTCSNRTKSWASSSTSKRSPAMVNFWTCFTTTFQPCHHTLTKRKLTVFNKHKPLCTSTGSSRTWTPRSAIPTRWDSLRNLSYPHKPSLKPNKNKLGLKTKQPQISFYSTHLSRWTHRFYTTNSQVNLLPSLLILDWLSSHDLDYSVLVLFSICMLCAFLAHIV